MASPFHVFRKYQGVLLAVFGVALMVAFVVLPPVLQMMQARQMSGLNKVVFRWTGGTLNSAEIAYMRNTRAALVQFQRAIQQEASDKDRSATFNRVTPIPMTDSVDSVVNTMLLAEKGRRLGLVVSDQVILDYLRNLSDGVLDNAAIRRIRSRVRDVKEMSDDSLFQALREELLAIKVRELAGSGLGVTTPAEAWTAFNRLDRRVKAEFLDLKVADFVKDVKTTPSENDLKQLYDEFKDYYHFPQSADPGFKERERIKFGWVEVDYNKYLEEEMAKITPEQIAEYYEANKETFIVRENPFGEQSGDSDDPRAAEPRPPQPPAETPATESPAAPETPAAEAPAAPATPAETPAAEAPATPATETPAAPAAGDGSLFAPADDFQFVAYQPAAEAPAETPASEAPAAETPAEPALPEVRPAGETPTTETPAAGGSDLDLPATKPVQYKPLSEVEAEIRRVLASKPAQDRVNLAINAIEAAIEDYRSKLIDAELGGHPGKFDIGPVAKKYNFKYGVTPFVDQLEAPELKDTAVGKSFILMNDPRFNQSRQVPFNQYAFQPGLQPYRAFVMNNPTDNEVRYIVWKEEEKPARVPDFVEVRKEVEAAWKTRAARELALQAAEKLAKEARASDQSLVEQFGEKYKVLTPPPFSYFEPDSVMLYRMQQGQIRPSSIEGIEENYFDNIRRRVVQMPEGEILVLPNATKTDYYVVRLEAEVTNPEQLKTAFLQTIVDQGNGGLPQDLQTINYQIDKSDIQSDWNEQIYKEFDGQIVDREFFQRQSRDE